MIGSERAETQPGSLVCLVGMSIHVLKLVNLVTEVFTRDSFNMDNNSVGLIIQHALSQVFSW